MRLIFHPDEYAVTISTETHLLRVEAVGVGLFEAMQARSAQDAIVALAEEHGTPKLGILGAGLGLRHLSAGVVAERIDWSGDV